MQSILPTSLWHTHTGKVITLPRSTYLYSPGGRGKNSYFPPPHNPMPQQFSPAHPQQQNDPTVSATHTSSSSSNNTPSEPTLDYSSWSPRSYCLGKKLLWRAKSKETHTRGHHCVSPLLSLPALRHTFSLAHTATDLLLLQAPDPTLSPQGQRCYTLTLFRPQSMVQLAHLTNGPTRQPGSPEITTVALKIPDRRVHPRKTPLGETAWNTITPTLTVFLTATADRQTDSDTQGIFSKMLNPPTDASRPIVIKIGNNPLTFSLHNRTIGEATNEIILGIDQTSDLLLLSPPCRAKKEPTPYSLRATGRDNKDMEAQKVAQGRLTQGNSDQEKDGGTYLPISASVLDPSWPISSSANMEKDFMSKAQSFSLTPFSPKARKGNGQHPAGPARYAQLQIQPDRLEADLHLTKGKVVSNLRTKEDDTQKEKEMLQCPSLEAHEISPPCLTVHTTPVVIKTAPRAKEKCIATRRSERIRARERPGYGIPKPKAKAGGSAKAKMASIQFQLHSNHTPLCADAVEVGARNQSDGARYDPRSCQDR